MLSRSSFRREQPVSGRRVVASFPSYDRAQQAVDTLADQRFPVEHLSIVAHDVRIVEHVTGRRGYTSSLMQGTSTGAVVGGAMGFLLGLFSLVDPLASAIVVAIWGAFVGGVAGAVIGLLGYALTDGRRDFTSLDSLEAASFEVVADDVVATDAEERLQKARLLQLPKR